MIKKTLHTLIWSRRKELPFIVLASFLTTFLGARLLLRIVLHSKNIPVMFLYIDVAGEPVHVHHLVYGVLLLSVISFTAVCYPNVIRKYRHFSSILLGFALGLIYDEFSLWLTLNEFYYAEVTYDAIIGVATLLLLLIYFPPFASYIKKKLSKRGKQDTLPLGN